MIKDKQHKQCRWTKMHNNGWIKNTMLTLSWPHISKDPSGPPGETHAAATLSTFKSSFILLSSQTSNIYSFLHNLNWWPYFTEQRESELNFLVLLLKHLPAYLLCRWRFALLLFVTNGWMICAPLYSQNLNLGIGSDAFLPTQGLYFYNCPISLLHH